jgi:hypothetical protein
MSYFHAWLVMKTSPSWAVRRPVMLKNFEEVSKWIEDGRTLHIAGSEKLLRELPKGSWIGGSTEHFMTEEGGVVSDNLLFVSEFTELGTSAYSIRDYGADTIPQITADAYGNGFSIAIIPFDCDVHNEYARNAAGYEGMFIKNIIGWISGPSKKTPGQPAVAVNGQTGQVFTDRAIALHLEIPGPHGRAVSEANGRPGPKTVSLGIINIHSPDEKSPEIEFDESGSNTVKTCRIDGKEVLFADYLRKNGHNIGIPLVGDYFGHGVNVSFRLIDKDEVQLYSPVFSGIKYRFAKNVPVYADAFREQLGRLKDKRIVFSCNCILNFMFGDLEGKKFGTVYGPITFGEVAYQLLNQTLVYVTVE